MLLNQNDAKYYISFVNNNIISSLHEVVMKYLL